MSIRLTEGGFTLLCLPAVPIGGQLLNPNGSPLVSDGIATNQRREKKKLQLGFVIQPSRSGLG